MASKKGSTGILNKTKGMYGGTKQANSNKIFQGPLSKRPSKSR